VPVAGIDTISIGFGEHVLNVSGGSLMVRGLTTTATPTLASVGGFTYDVGTHVATWKFSAPLAADQYLLTLADTVTDVVGNALDGEWTNPFSVDTTNALVSEFPSGNGVAGGAFRFVFTVLPGDASLDNYVNGNDFVIWQGSLGGPGRTFAQADFTGDGTTSSADLTVWQNNSGAKLRDLVFADFNQDTVVNFLDFSILSGNYGSTTADHDDGDADGDGDVDGNDFVMLQRQLGLTLTWVA
ncbi:MAG TPA: dockerin type I domain-containing protein, partial [Lacipirellulaceae bacterium]|nr:dockerin type I domain-containing protein [Lacipirellulaceae bacterium]